MDWMPLATIGAPIVTLLGAWLVSRRQRQELRDIHSKVGNGFASEVMTKLDAITIDVGVLKGRMNKHINQHAQGAFASNLQSGPMK